jgi:hypothetical protein
MANRYDADPTRRNGKKDLVEYITELFNRTSKGETVQRIGNTAVEDGNLTIRNGDLIVSESSGFVVLKLLHGAVPEVRFFPIGDTSDHRAALFGQGSSPPFPTTTITMNVETNPGGVQDGGKLILDQTYAVLSYHPLASGGNESYFWLNIDNAAPEIMAIQGKWSNKLQYSTLQGVYPGSDSLGAGFGSYTHTYLSAFASTVIPIVTLFNSGGTVSWNLTAQSTSSFTVTWSGTTAKTINWWVYRI